MLEKISIGRFMSTECINIFFESQDDYDNYYLDQMTKESPFIYKSFEIYNNIPLVFKPLFKIHNSERINSIVKLPFKSIWARYLLDKNVSKTISDAKNCLICFHFVGMQYRYFERGYLRYLKKRYPRAVFFFSFNDTVANNKKWFKRFSLDKLKTEFDYVTTYNTLDSKQYDLLYLNHFTIPQLKLDSSLDTTTDYDIIFVGKDKGRLQQILDFAVKCVTLGLKIKFYLIGIPVSKRKSIDGIVYCDYIPYVDVIKMSRKSKAILNLLQAGASGLSLRDREAIGMNRILVTNSNYLLGMDLYTEDKIVLMDSIENDINKFFAFNSNKRWNNVDNYSVHSLVLTFKKLAFARNIHKDNEK